MKKESKSNWECVAQEMSEVKELSFGRYVSYWYHKTPRRLLHSISYYKFASKMIGSGKRVLDIGCNEGFGTWLLAKECGFAKGIDFDSKSIEVAKANYNLENIEFCLEDFLASYSPETYDAVVNFDVIEHIYPEHEELFMQSLKSKLSDTGLAVIGTPSLNSQQYASEIARKGHVNIYSPERLEEMMKKHFEFVFIFPANDEIVHVGFLPFAHYFIAIGCKKKGL